RSRGRDGRSRRAPGVGSGECVLSLPRRARRPDAARAHARRGVFAKEHQAHRHVAPPPRARARAPRAREGSFAANPRYPSGPRRAVTARAVRSRRAAGTALAVAVAIAALVYDPRANAAEPKRTLGLLVAVVALGVLAARPARSAHSKPRAG